MQERVYWAVRYYDGTILKKYEDNIVNDYAGIEQDKVDEFYIYHDDVPIFATKFHPDIMRLILFYRAGMQYTFGVGTKDLPRRLFFGYQMTVDFKNYQVLWSIGEDGDIRTEARTGRKNCKELWDRNKNDK